MMSSRSTSLRGSAPVGRRWADFCRRVFGLFVLGVLAGAAMPVVADVYIWIDPKTGRKTMSNFLPSWLRDAQPSQRLPKYEIWRDGKKIDLATALGSPPPVPEAPTRSTPGQPAIALPPGTPGAGVEAPYNDDE